MRPLWNVVQNLARTAREVGRAIWQVASSLLRDPFVVVPLLIAGVLIAAALSEAWVPLWRTGTSSVEVPLWIALILSGLLVLLAVALYAYAFGDDE